MVKLQVSIFIFPRNSWKIRRSQILYQLHGGPLTFWFTLGLAGPGPSAILIVLICNLTVKQQGDLSCLPHWFRRTEDEDPECFESKSEDYNMFWSRCITCTKRVFTISLSSLVTKRRILEFTKILTSLQLFLINLILFKRFISRSVPPKDAQLDRSYLVEKMHMHLFLQANFFNNCIAQVMCTKL